MAAVEVGTVAVGHHGPVCHILPCIKQDPVCVRVLQIGDRVAVKVLNHRTGVHADHADRHLVPGAFGVHSLTVREHEAHRAGSLSRNNGLRVRVGDVPDQRGDALCIRILIQRHGEQARCVS